MECYKVAVAPPGRDASDRCVLLHIQLDSSARVDSLVDQALERLPAEYKPNTPGTHILTLHRDSENGPVISNSGDTLSHVIPNPATSYIYGRFSEKPDEASPRGANTRTIGNMEGNGHSNLSIRVVTPELAIKLAECPIMQVSSSTTVRDLHQQIVERLQLGPTSLPPMEGHECNCALARKLTLGALKTDHVVLVRGKGVVEHIPLRAPWKAALKIAIMEHLGGKVDVTKEVNIIKSDKDEIDTLESGRSGTDFYRKLPVVAICSKWRHIPGYQRLGSDRAGQETYKVLDLHTHELSIHPCCFGITLEQAGIHQLASEGIIDIFAVHRTATDNEPPPVGKSAIFRSRPHWEPPLEQSIRGTAMFLSCLRVISTVVRDMRTDPQWKDAIFHVFDLFTKFPPALRCLHILVHDATPTASECAALSHAMFQVLKQYMPLHILSLDDSRIFEYTLLFLGFVLQSAHDVKLPARHDGTQSGRTTLPYLSSFQTINPETMIYLKVF
ncbi:hypothetical protein F5Y16DRAFT_422032 [Xylariaceae sp. FL0255]|nr:hypothetical protein F5Y16DRAFT_422032 [Xylariaceae sp. FL0255]